MPKETTMKIVACAAALLAMTVAMPAFSAEDAKAQGEVKKIDESAGKITLKHGPIKNLGMNEGMTMAFRVKDPAMLREVKVGDKVEFEAENASSGYTVTKLQKSQ